MHRTIYLFLLLILGISEVSIAQQTDYPVAISSAAFQKVVGTRNGNILLLVEEKGQYAVLEFDTLSLTPKSRLPLTLAKDLSVTRTLSGVYLIGASLKVIYRQTTAVSNETSLCLYACDTNGIVPTSVQEFKLGGWDKDDFIFYTTNAKQDCLLFGRASKAFDNTEIDFETFLIDEQSEIMNRFVSRDVIAGENREYLQSSIAINDKHEIFIYSFRNWFDKSEKKYGAEVMLKTYAAGQTQPSGSSSFFIPKGYSCAELSFHESGNQCSLTGIYQNYNGKVVNGYLGVFRVALKENGEFDHPIFTKYTDQTRLRTLKGAELTEGVSVRPFYTLHSQLLDSKGNTYVIQERQTINSEGEFYYGSILISKFDSTGNLLWDNVLPKSQFFKLKGIGSWAYYLLPPALSLIMYATITGTDEGYLSFKASLVNDEIQLLFNDIQENENRQGFTERAPYTKPEKGVPYAITVLEDGTFTYACHANLKPSGEPFVLKNGYFLNGYYFLVSKDKKRGYILSKVRF